MTSKQSYRTTSDQTRCHSRFVARFFNPVHAVALVFLWCSSGVTYAQTQACCDSSTDAFHCYRDDIGVGSLCVADGLGDGSTCVDNCGCGPTCPAVVTPTKGNGSVVEISLASVIFDGTNTTFNYEICQVGGAALSHWVLGVPSLCCLDIVSTSASVGLPSTTCSTDPTTGLAGIKFDETASSTGIPDCGFGVANFSVTLVGFVSTGCVKVGTKANGMEDVAFACIQGPDCCVPDCTGKQCGDDGCGGTCGSCDDGDPCNGVESCDGAGLCQPGTPVSCSDDTLFCNGPETCNSNTGLCESGPSPCDPATERCCDIPDTCVLAGGCCSDGECDDGNECTDDGCLAGTCSHTNKPIGTLCADDGATCTDDICIDGSCSHAPVEVRCDDGNECTEDFCDPTDLNADPMTGCVNRPLPDGTLCNGAPSMDSCDAQDTCVAGVCVDHVQPVGFVCRTVAGLCDIEEICDGISNECPMDGFRDGTKICRPLGGICDMPEFCSGISVDCPIDGFQPDTKVCRPAVSECDVVDLCTGVSADCPEDVCQMQGTPCTDDGLECTDDICDGACQCTHPNLPNNTTCGNSISEGDCDDPDSCQDGVCDESTKPSGTLCRAAVNECDTDEVCDGITINCPMDECKPANTPCSSDMNECTDDVCDGVCNCTHPELIDGTDCGDPIPQGVCDNPDICVGGTCSTNPKPPGSSCTDDGNQCTNDRCDGMGLCDHVDNNLCGACCLKDGNGGCVDDVFEEQCPNADLRFFLGRNCTEFQCNDEVIVPTVNTWGIAIITLLLLIGGKIYFGWRFHKTDRTSV